MTWPCISVRGPQSFNIFRDRDGACHVSRTGSWQMITRPPVSVTNPPDLSLRGEFCLNTSWGKVQTSPKLREELCTLASTTVQFTETSLKELIVKPKSKYSIPTVLTKKSWPSLKIPKIQFLTGLVYFLQDTHNSSHDTVPGHLCILVSHLVSGHITGPTGPQGPASSSHNKETSGSPDTGLQPGPPAFKYWSWERKVVSSFYLP